LTAAKVSGFCDFVADDEESDPDFVEDDGDLAVESESDDSSSESVPEPDSDPAIEMGLVD
jgi:hypothetical protein